VASRSKGQSRLDRSTSVSLCGERTIDLRAPEEQDQRTGVCGPPARRGM